MSNHSAVIDLKQIKVSKEIYDDLKYKELNEIEEMGSVKKELGSPHNIANLNENEVQSILTAN